MYLDTLIIGHKFCYILSILNKLHEELQNYMINNMFWTHKKQYTNSKEQTEPGIEPGNVRNAVG